MLDLERRVAQSLKKVRDAHTESYREELPRLRNEIVRRTKRRRRSMAGIAAATASAVVAALVVVPMTFGDRDGTAPAAGDRTFIEIPTGAPSHLAASGNNVWLVSPTELRRIDATTNRLATLVQDVDPTWVRDITADDDIVWVVGEEDGDGVLRSELESRWGIVGGRYDGSALEAVVAAEGYVWVADRASSSVWKMNPRTGSLVQRYRRILGAPFRSKIDFAAGYGFIWLLAGDKVVQIDPEESDGSFGIVVGDCAGLAVGEGAVWVLDSCRDVVARYDPETLEPTALIPSEGRDFGDKIAAGLGSVWITGDSVTRIDAETNRIVGAPIEVDGGASEIAVSDDSVWLSTPKGVLRYSPDDVAPPEETPRGDE